MTTCGPRQIAVVSGKGGVGKTLIATNLARMASYERRVLLIDFDFPNQGLTGLLSQFLQPAHLSAKELIGSADLTHLTNIVQIRDNFYFIPAFALEDDERFRFTLNTHDVATLVAILTKRKLELSSYYNFDVIILDCHGGLDDISYASFRTSDYTLIMSEPNLVTFNGTLELIDYYMNTLGSANRSSDSETLSPNAVSTHDVERKDFAENKVIFVLNRMSGRFLYRPLLAAYQRQLSLNFPDVASIIANYSFIPADSLVARSFSEYPFYIELLPESIFIQKLVLIYKTIFSEEPKIPGRSAFYRIFEKKTTRRLERYLTSDDERRAQAIFAFAVSAQVFLLLAVITGAVFYTSLSRVFPHLDELSLKMSKSVSEQTLEKWGDYMEAALVVGSMVFGVVMIGAAYIDIIIGQYYRDSFRYEYRLRQRGGQRLSVTLLARSIRLFATRVYLDAAAIVFFVAGLYLLVPDF